MSQSEVTREVSARFTGSRLDQKARKPRSTGDMTWAFASAPEGIRTPNLLIRSQMLYPLSYGRLFNCRILPRGVGPLRRLRDLNPGGGVTPNRISSAAP